MPARAQGCLARAGGFLDNWWTPSYNERVAVRRSGGIGRRTGLKIPGRQRRAGSSPAFGTIMNEPRFSNIFIEKRGFAHSGNFVVIGAIFAFWY